MYIIRQQLTISIVAIYLLVSPAAAADTTACKGTVILDIAATPVTVEVARDERSRRYGLMFRQQLGANCGMLFVFDANRARTFTMRNTLIALDIAFITDQGVIAEILTMQPGVAQYPSSVQARYALEVNAGWFKEKNIATGSSINILQQNQLQSLSSINNGR